MLARWSGSFGGGEVCEAGFGLREMNGALVRHGDKDVHLW
jgi:hypothetical protein